MKAWKGLDHQHFKLYVEHPGPNCTDCVFVAIFAASAKYQALAQLERQGAFVSDSGERHVCCCGQELAFGLLQLL